jgi:acetoin utilization deacetylase AcuC-like enzyme
MHGRANYPLLKETSDLDIPLDDFTEDAQYLSILKNELDKLLDLVQPEFIFFQSGVDILKTDKLGRLWISREGCKQRDRIVLKLAKDNDIPLVASMGGGYSENFRDIIEAHANTFRLAQEIFF